jgi:hypothetical protein
LHCVMLMCLDVFVGSVYNLATGGFYLLFFSSIIKLGNNLTSTTPN